LYARSVVQLPTHLRGTSTGASRVSRAELAAHQRERVITSATPVFAKRGYQATTVDDLLAAAKMGFGNFYSLFAGKEECFLACLEETVVGARGRMAEAASAGEDWASRTYLGLRSLLSDLLASPLAARLVLLESQTAGAESLSRYNALIDETIAWVSAGPGKKDLRESFAQTSVLGLAFYLQQCALDPRSHELGTLVEETSALLLEPLIGSEHLRALARSFPAAA
jgi:AcrR family transcriptional regulator